MLKTLEVIVQCGLLAPKATNLSVVANEFQMTYFKHRSLRKKYPCNCRSFSSFFNHLQSAQIHENATKIALNPRETSRCTVPDRLWIINITCLTAETYINFRESYQDPVGS